LIQYDQGSSAPALLQSYLDMVRRNLSVVDRTISQYGNLSLREYLTSFSCEIGASFQGRDELLDIVCRYVAPLLGKAVAKETLEDLAAHPIVLTSNHHGVDYYAQTLQARLIFSLRSISKTSSARTVPVFACGNIPLNNPTYPRGLLLYRCASGNLDAMPHKLPLFPDRLKRTMVSAAPAYDETMVGSLQGRLDRMISQGSLPSDVGVAARNILVEVYRYAALGTVSDYSRQAVILNSLIWKRLFAKGFSPPEMIYLELEKIVDALLALDLSNRSSLAWGVLFDPTLRENVLAELNGIKGCWNLDVLGQRSATIALGETHPGAGRYCGTVFFWGVDRAGRRIPLHTARRSSGEVVFRGMDDEGTALEILLTTDAISKSLQERQLVPSLFTCFLVLAFARGVCCVGGYFQCEYLPAMQRGLAAALQSTPGYGDVAQAVLQVPTTLYLDGMIAVMSRIEDGLLIPAGLLEIIAGGGLTEEDIVTMLALKVREAHLADLFETVPDGAPPESRTTGWKRQLAAAGSAWLEGRVVVK
jgi:hypothetical protein